MHVREGLLSIVQTVQTCLQRVSDNQSLDAFECLHAERAPGTASALEALLSQGTDLGPMMGLPMGGKDISRPTLSEAQLELTDQVIVGYALKTVYRDKTTERIAHPDTMDAGFFGVAAR